MLSMYVFSDGNTAKQSLNAVAMFMNGGGFAALISLSATFSIVATAFQYIMTRDLMSLLKWFAVYFTVTVILVGVPVSVKVVDVTNPMKANTIVDNVPYGIAMSASVISSISYGLSQGVADVFHTTDDGDYNQTGMLFGAKVYHSVLQSATIVDSDTRGALSDFVSQCIIPDIKINHKYTFNQVANAPDIFAFLNGTSKTGKSFHMSPLRGIFYKQKFMTCADALPKIEAAVSTQTQTQFAEVGRLLGMPGKLHINDVENTIQNSQQYLMGMSMSAKNTLMQNVAVNAVREGIGTSFAKGDATAALMNYASTTAMQKQLLTDFAEGHQATYMLPLMQTTFFLLMVILFPVVVLLAMQPLLFKKMLSTYLISLIYLGLWPVCFTIINFMVQTRLQLALISAAQAGGTGAGITLSNQNAMLYMMEQSAGYASSLVALVPVIAGGVLFGMHRVFMSAAQVMVGTMQREVMSVSDPAATGNISMGDTSVGNHSWNNVSANKWDTNATHFAGSSSQNTGAGAIVTTTPDGNTVVNATGAQSQLPVGLNMAHNLSASLQASSDHARTAAVSEQKSFNTAVSNVGSQIESYSATHGTNSSEGHGSSVGNTTSLDHAMTTLQQLSHEASQATGVTEAQASTAMTQMSLGVHGSGNVGISSPKVAAWANGSVGAKVGTEGQEQSTHSHNVNSSANASHSESRLDQFRSALQTVQTYGDNHHSETGSSKSASFAAQLSSNLNQATTASHNYSTDRSESARLSEQASYVQHNAASINANLAQPFANYVANHASSTAEANNILGNANDPATNQLRNQMASNFMQSREAQLKQQFTTSQPGHLNTMSKTGNASVSGDSAVRAAHSRDNARIEAKGAGAAFNQNAYLANNQTVDSMQHALKQKIVDGQQDLQGKAVAEHGKTSDAINTGGKRAEKGLLGGLADAVIFDKDINPPEGKD